MSESIEKKLAMFKSCGGYETEAGEWAEDNKEYTRTTEYVTVAFPRLPVQQIVEGQLAALDNAEANLREKFQESLDRIICERGKLLAITHNG